MFDSRQPIHSVTEQSRAAIKAPFPDINFDGTGEPLVKSEYEWENVHAHKPWFVRNNGKSYHFYCAVNDKNERFIAVATSE